MTVRYVDLVDYVAIAAEITGLDVAIVLKIANLNPRPTVDDAEATSSRSRPASSTKRLLPNGSAATSQPPIRSDVSCRGPRSRP